MKTNMKITALKGVGAKTQALFQKIGLETIFDLIHYYPRSYQRYEAVMAIAELAEGQVAAICGKIVGRIQVSSNRNLPITSLSLKDDSGNIKVVWYRMPFLRNTLRADETILLRGKILRKKNELVMEHPELFVPSDKYEEKRNTLQPTYALTGGLSNKTVQKSMQQAFVSGIQLEDYLPADILMEYQLCSYFDSIRALHFPNHENEYMQGRKRLVFDEFLLFVLSIRTLKENRQKEENTFSFQDLPEINRLIEDLPYDLTGAQQKVWQDIKRDLLGISLMNRLVQGDVGSGKTIIALLALLFVTLNGCQGAFMAPTEILAVQHFENTKRLLKAFQINIGVELLIGSMLAGEKRAAYDRIASGEAQIIVGTHALIQEKVNYQNLALVITDEQHRFGVKQRERFYNKGKIPHVLVMSATPIPRTLAVILYGDLDISVIDALPKNRLPIKNCVVDIPYRKTAYTFMSKEVEAGRQCYIICPMVAESENIEAENVIDYTKKLQKVMDKSIQIGYLHGKMKQIEKDEIMERFAKNQLQVLVSTTVIEVGIDVPNATVMLIENAERFGLAQLHQLRGRVGRGKYQSYCIFMSPVKKKETRERLKILNSSNDGFFIASEDLRLRGPGDIFGIRQSGIMGFTLGDVYQDAGILQQVNKAADAILNKDFTLQLEEHQPLKKKLKEYQEKQMPLLIL
ncbi:MAG: ATP-dependent DNA helicase RecG [Lachnospiraceae bacterium]|nr:ATP-dependent DNA helicase RecG [Lachnospiraceae bacterium]